MRKAVVEIERSLREEAEPGNAFKVRYKSEVHTFTPLTVFRSTALCRPSGMLLHYKGGVHFFP